MGKIFDVNPEKLSFLLESIHNREVALPDFQRDFVWDARATEELIESICQNYPAGSLLRIENAKEFYFEPREFAGAPVLGPHKPSYLILDGQQRLTSLYQALYGAGEHRYFIDLSGLVKNDDLEDYVFYLGRKEAAKRYGKIEQQAHDMVFPFELLFGSTGGFEEWLDSILEICGTEANKQKSIKKDMRDVYRKWVEPLVLYEFPMVTLGENTTGAAVCTIFETLNRTGVKLSVFDLLAARFWTKDVKLRDLWEKVQQECDHIADFDIDPYYMIQSVALFAANAAPSCKRKDVLELTVDQIKKGWDSVVTGLSATLEILAHDCGVLVPQWIPYNTIIIPMAAALATAMNAKGPNVAAIRNKLKRWFWCSVFMQTYEKSPNSQAVKDYIELKEWFVGGQEPETVRKFSFNPNTLREITPRQRAIYRGIMILVLRNGARDFHKADPITAKMIKDYNIDDHHIFPKGYLEDVGVQVKGVLMDCVLNRTLIDRETNNNIRKKAPSIYLDEIAKKIGDSKLTSLLGSHFLPGEPSGPLRQDKFDVFLDMRQQAIWQTIQEVTK